MDSEAFFWKIMRNEIPPPRAAETLGIAFRSVDAEAGIVEVEFQGRAEFTNPAGVGVLTGRGRVLRKGRDVCYLAAELYQGGDVVASATATAIVRSLPK